MRSNLTNCPDTNPPKDLDTEHEEWAKENSRKCADRARSSTLRQLASRLKRAGIGLSVPGSVLDRDMN